MASARSWGSVPSSEVTLGRKGASSRSCISLVATRSLSVTVTSRGSERHKRTKRCKDASSP
eukprot:scaffold8522_cov2749-Pinguiococcus_pyrenoidosus.AAC.1